MGEKDEMTVRVSLVRKRKGKEQKKGPVVEHTYKTQKAALWDYTLLGNLLKRFSEMSEDQLPAIDTPTPRK